MNRFKVKTRFRGGFTVVEILVVIAIIGILATVSIVSYGAWRRSVTSATLKSDLNGVIAAMESHRTYNNGYPTAVPPSFTPSEGVLLSGGSADAKTYCVEATSSDDASLVFYAASEVKDKGPQEGACATRPTLPAPVVPTNLAVSSSVGTTVNLTWTGIVSDVASYDVQCASDAAFVVGVQTASPAFPATSAAVGGLSPSSTYYCHIRSVNATGKSDWSASVNTTTTNNYGSLAVATSIEGYWTLAPKGFLLEDGAAVSRTTYADLFAVIGTTYGAGDGSTTFNLPDSRGRTGVNISTDTEFASVGQKTGANFELLTIAELPVHTHTQNSHNHIVIDPGHNHTQNAHNHAQHVTAMSGGSTRSDWDGDGSGLSYPQNAYTSATVATNNGAYTGVSLSAATATNQNNGNGATHDNIQPSIVKMFAIKYAPIDPTAVQLPAGTSISGYWNTTPSGYLAEDGAQVSRTTYADLFAAIGTTYGAGNGSTTFTLPDSRGRAAVNKSTDVEFDTMGEKPGSKREALTIAQIPSHTHTQNLHTHALVDPGHNHTQNAHAHVQYVTANSGGSAIRNDWNNDTPGGVYPQGAYTAYATPTNVAAVTGVYLSATTATNQNTGSGSSHNEIQPSIVRRHAIKTTAATTTGTQVAPGTSLAGYWLAAPAGYLVEDGTAVSRTTYADLFAVIGTTYGAGNGSTTFNLPDSRGRLSVNRNPADATFDTMGEKTGTKTVTLTIAQLASHTHIQNSHTHAVSDPGHNHAQNAHSHMQVVTANSGGSAIRIDYNSDASGGIYAQGVGTGDATATNNASGTGIVIDSTPAVNQNNGSGGAHNNIQPSIVKLFVIKY